MPRHVVAGRPGAERDVEQHDVVGAVGGRVQRRWPSGTAVTRWPSRSNERVSISRSGRSSSTSRISSAVEACTAGA